MTQSTEHRVSWQGPWSGAWGNQLQAEPSIGWLHKELIERAAFGVGLRRFLVVIALLNSAKTRTCAQEHSCMFRGQLLTVDFYLLYLHWQRLKCFLAATWFNLVVCYVEQNTLLRRSLELNSLRHLYIFILCNTKKWKKCKPAGNVRIHKHVFFVMTYFDKSKRGNLWLFECLYIHHNSRVPKIQTVAASPASCVHHQLRSEHCWWCELLLLDPVPSGDWLDREHNPSCSRFV